MKRNFLFFLIITTFLSIIFSGVNPQAAKAATVPNLSPKNLTKEETRALFFSTLVYSDLSKFEKRTKLVDMKFDALKAKSDPLQNFKDEWKKIQKEHYYPSMKVSEFIEYADLEKWILDDYESDDITGFFGAVFKNTKTEEYVIAFRGTSDSGDISKDLSGITSELYNTQMDNARKLFEQVNPKYKVTATGHSLGGFLATSITLEKGIPSVVFNAPSPDEYSNIDNANRKLVKTFSINLDPIGKYNSPKKNSKTNIYYDKKDNQPSTSVGGYHDLSNFYQYADKPLYDVATGVISTNLKEVEVLGGPGTNFAKLGSLKNGTKITTYSHDIYGYSLFNYEGKEGYVSNQYIKNFSDFELSEAKKIVDGLIGMQDKIRLGDIYYFTKTQIIDILSPGFTPEYINKYMKEDMMPLENKYIFRGTDNIAANPNTIFIDSWVENEYVKKPTVEYYRFKGSEYLLISQYRKPFDSMVSSHNGFYDNLYLIKESPNSNWKAYDMKHPKK
ncbi:SH3 domain-containing protein [Lysinibacillus sp. M3]|uniref:SH3 domain-containing protein n=1 Tax=Lysinibacillus zambalensis TaxID=3160866 RepID=A0ABV1MP36_9BACI